MRVDAAWVGFRIWRSEVVGLRSVRVSVVATVIMMMGHMRHAHDDTTSQSSLTNKRAERRLLTTNL